MKLQRILLLGLMVLGAAIAPARPALAQYHVSGPGDPPPPPPPLPLPDLFTHYYDVATSTSPSASGYGGGGASGGVGDGLVRIINTGNLPLQQNGTICAMIYVFDDIEEMQACCGCPVTPDGMRTMSVINNLTKNFGVNRGNMNAGVVEMFGTNPNLKLPKPVPLPPQIGPVGSSGYACDPSLQFGPTIGVSELDSQAFPGEIQAWMTNTEGNAPVPATSKTLIKGMSVDEFQGGFLLGDFAHQNDLFSFCLFLIQNGSGTGACSCGSGDSFSTAQLDLCEFSGGPGWGNAVFTGGSGVDTSDATPQDCCKSCVADSNCAQWAFDGVCSHNVPPNVCTGSEISVTNGGMIRCN